MLQNFTNKIVNSLLGSDEVGSDELLDRQTAQIESGDVHIRPEINSHWASAMADIIQVPGCSCIWCRRNNESDGDSKVERGQPSHPRKMCDLPMATTSGVLEVLYPPSYLNTPSTLDPEARPPAYELRPTVPPNTPQVQPPPIFSREDRNLIPLTPRLPHSTTSLEPVSPYNLYDTDTPLDAAIPSAQSPRSRPSPRIAPQPITGLGLEFPEAADNAGPPAYSQFDSSRLRFPVASDTLGPYPHISMLSPR